MSDDKNKAAEDNQDNEKSVEAHGVVLKKATYKRDEVVKLLDKLAEQHEQNLEIEIAEREIKAHIKQKAKLIAHYKTANKQCTLTDEDFIIYLYDLAVPVKCLHKLRDEDYKLIKQNKDIDPKLVWKMIRDRD
jgi:hypothetical protein